VDKLSHKHEIRTAALNRQLSAYSGYSPWFFVMTFLFTVCAVIVAFFFAKGVWSQRQDLAAKSIL
jgi:ABC-type multidrug transport system permease subunit